MLSYQHGYHAGNFADVLKHLTLTRILSYMKQKDKPLFYLETHAGKGQYDLKDKQSEKTGEYKEGIEYIWNNKKLLPDVYQDYMQVLNEINPNGKLRHYPGSPLLAIKNLRHQDRIYLCELHPTEFNALNKLPHFNKKVFVSNTDGIKQLKALLPPQEKRGLIFINPSYEMKDEYKNIPLAIKQAYSHFANGVYCLWYPLVNKKFTEQLHLGISDIGAKNTLKIEFYHTLAQNEGMTGCGLSIINPPFTLAEEMNTVLKTLKTYFNPDTSSYLIES